MAKIETPKLKMNLNLALESRWKGLTLVKMFWKKNH